jgi:hypothetical protein
LIFWLHIWIVSFWKEVANHFFYMNKTSWTTFCIPKYFFSSKDVWN